MKVTVAALIVLALFALDSLAQDYTQWLLPDNCKGEAGQREDS